MARYLDPALVLKVEHYVKRGHHTVKEIARRSGIHEKVVAECLQALRRSGKVAHGWFCIPRKRGSSGNKGVGVWLDE